MATVLSQDDIDELNALRKVFDYSSAVQRVEDYGKWVFTAVASITALGAGLSNSAFKVLSGPGKLCFAFAIVLAGISLASAALLLAPQWLAVNRWSRDSMRNGLILQFQRRRVLTMIAGYSLGLALVLAGLAPALSSLYPPTPAITKLAYSYSKGALDITLSLANVAPNSDAVLEIIKIDNQMKNVPVAKLILHADESGAANRAIQISAPAGTYQLSYSCRTASGQKCSTQPEIVMVSNPGETTKTDARSIEPQLSNASAQKAATHPKNPKAKKQGENK
jgi:hypothetical protein